MFRIIWFLVVVLAVAAGFSWLADRPGTVSIDWEGYRGELSVFNAVVILVAASALITLTWLILRQLWLSPATVGQYFMKRKQKRGLDALSSGMIAVGAGDRSGSMRYALQARKTLPNEPLTHLLRAQAAQLSGDRATARRIFEAMLSSPDTEQLGLRGLYLEAIKVGEAEPARQFAERALKLNPRLAWPVEALFELQCKASDWAGAIETLASGRKHGHFEKADADRKRAVLLAAQAQSLEDGEPDKALALALESHGLAPSLVPSSAIAGRLLAAKGSTPKAAKVIQKTWAKAPHPDLATAYAYARIGDSPRDRLTRVKQLSALNPHSIESPIAVAIAAIEAKDYAEARRALGPLLETRLTQRVATLMARIEGEEHGNKGKVREWLARAVNAPRDPAWTADGVVSDRWAPASPVTGQLDAFQWRVPVDELQAVEGEELATRLESLVALGGSVDTETASEVVEAEAQDAQEELHQDKVREKTARSASKAVSTRAQPEDVVEEDATKAGLGAEDAEIVPTTDPAREARRTEPASPPASTAPAPEPRLRDKGASTKSASRAQGDGPASGGAAPSESSATSGSQRAARTVAGGAASGSVAAGAMTDVSPAAKSPAATASTGGSARGRAADRDAKGRRKGESHHRDGEHDIVLPTRAPDDPGPDGDDTEDATGKFNPYRA